MGTITYSVRSVIDKFGDDLKPGDIILTNDPYNGSGTHLCDVSAIMPIFYKGETIAFAANKGHWNEIGGNPWEAGLQIPPKYIRKGFNSQLSRFTKRETECSNKRFD